MTIKETILPLADTCTDALGKKFHVQRDARAALVAALDAADAENEKLRDIARLHYGYAKGYYMNKCIRCEAQMEFVDKRCHVCVDCADKAIDAAHAALGDAK